MLCFSLAFIYRQLLDTHFQWFLLSTVLFPVVTRLGVGIKDKRYIWAAIGYSVLSGLLTLAALITIGIEWGINGPGYLGIIALENGTVLLILLMIFLAALTILAVVMIPLLLQEKRELKKYQ